MKQVKFIDTSNHNIHGGILLDDGSVICACCGGLFESDEVGDEEDKDSEYSIRILEVFDEWVNFDDYIIA